MEKAGKAAIREKGVSFGAPSLMPATYATELLAGRWNVGRSVPPGAVHDGVTLGWLPGDRSASVFGYRRSEPHGPIIGLRWRLSKTWALTLSSPSTTFCRSMVLSLLPASRLSQRWRRWRP